MAKLFWSDFGPLPITEIDLKNNRYFGQRNRQQFPNIGPMQVCCPSCSQSIETHSKCVFRHITNVTSFAACASNNWFGVFWVLYHPAAASSKKRGKLANFICILPTIVLRHNLKPFHPYRGILIQFTTERSRSFITNCGPSRHCSVAQKMVCTDCTGSTTDWTGFNPG